MKKKMLLTTALSFLAQVVTLGCGFVLPRLIIGQFGSDVNGLTQSIKQFLGVITFLDLGVCQVVRSALYKPLVQGDHHRLSVVMASGRKFYRRLIVILSGYLAVLVLVYPMLAEGEFGWVYTATLILAIAISSFAQFCFGIINEQLLHADQRGYIIYGLQCLSALLNLAVCAVLIHTGASIQMVKLVSSLVFLLRPIVVWRYSDRHYQIEKNISYTGEPIAQKWNGIAHHISAVVLDGTDVIVLTLFSTFTNVSVYSVYYMVIAGLQQFYQSATAGVQSAAGALWAGDDRRAQNRMFERVEPALHFVTVFLFSCAGLLIVPFVRVYTDGLTDADYIQPLFAGLLVIAYGIRCLRTPYNIWILAAGHYKQTQRCHIIAAAVNLILSVVAVWRCGLVGVAVGTLIAMIYQTGWMAWYNVRQLLRRPAGTVLKQFALDALTAGLIVLTCRGFVLTQVSYLGWVLLAAKTACIALAITVAVAFLFYRNIFLRKAG